MEEIDRNKDKSCNEKNKRIFKIIFCPCYCFCYKTFKCFCDERFGFEPYYETFFFIENIFFCLISIIDLSIIIYFKKNLCTSFLVLRIISDSIGILVLWLSIVLWNEDLSDEDHFTPGFLCITLISLILMSLIDISSFIIFCISKCVSIQIVIYSFIIHTILSIGTIIFDRFKIR